MSGSRRGVAIPTGNGRPLTTYEKDRTCALCDTRLSRYNESPWCSVHRGWGDAHETARRPGA
jgi:hypothetical protein